MMWFWLLTVLAVIIAVVVGVAATKSADGYENGRLRGVVVAFAIGVILCSILVGTSVHKVPVQNIGIVHSFNKQTGQTTGSGLKVTAPWEGISDWDGSKQTYDYRSGDDCVLGDKRYPGVKVRIASLANACVEGLVQWEIIDKQAPTQWANYKKDFGLFQRTRVEPAITTAFNESFAIHDPLKNINAEGNLNVPLQPYADQIEVAIRKSLLVDVVIHNVMVTRVNYDDRTQGFIDTFQQEILKGRTLEKAKVNAELQAQITAKNSVRDFRAWCLEIAEAKGGEPGFCLGGGNPVQNTRK